MERITRAREASQPIREKTGGSTFKNPPGAKAWELIDEAGCRGLTIGDAQVSPMHCNFLINRGGATAAELEALGEEVRRRVRRHERRSLEWEIKRIGVPAAHLLGPDRHRSGRAPSPASPQAREKANLLPLAGKAADGVGRTRAVAGWGNRLSCDVSDEEDGRG